MKYSWLDMEQVFFAAIEHRFYLNSRKSEYHIILNFLDHHNGSTINRLVSWNLLNNTFSSNTMQERIYKSALASNIGLISPYPERRLSAGQKKFLTQIFAPLRPLLLKYHSRLSAYNSLLDKANSQFDSLVWTFNTFPWYHQSSSECAHRMKIKTLGFAMRNRPDNNGLTRVDDFICLLSAKSSMKIQYSPLKTLEYNFMSNYKVLELKNISKEQVELAVGKESGSFDKVLQNVRDIMERQFH